MASLNWLLGSSMPLIAGEIKTDSRKTTNSYPSPDTSVTYLLSAGASPKSMVEMRRVKEMRMRKGARV